MIQRPPTKTETHVKGDAGVQRVGGDLRQGLLILLRASPDEPFVHEVHDRRLGPNAMRLVDARDRREPIELRLAAALVCKLEKHVDAQMNI